MKGKTPSLDELSRSFGTDKSSAHNHYTQYYARYFEPLRRRPVSVLEIGVGYPEIGMGQAASLKTWKAYFPLGQIYGLDINPKCKQYEEERVSILVGDQGDEIFLQSVCRQVPEGFDLILDDGSHWNDHILASFKTLFPALKAGGIYVIEDLGCSYHAKGANTFPRAGYENRREEMDAFLLAMVHALDKKGIFSCADFEKVPHDQRQLLSDYERQIESIHLYQYCCFIFKRGIIAA